MRHHESGSKLGVSAPHRKAMLRSMTLAIIEHDSIKTTSRRAKELRWWAEHVVTLAKRGDIASRRQIISLLGCTETQKNKENRVRAAIDRVYTHLVPRFQTRTGGYTQILKLVKRRAGDNADMVVMRYLPEHDEKKDKSTKKAKSAGGEKKKVAAADKGSKKAGSASADKKPREKKAPEDKPAKKKETSKGPEDKA